MMLVGIRNSERTHIINKDKSEKIIIVVYSTTYDVKKYYYIEFGFVIFYLCLFVFITYVLQISVLFILCCTFCTHFGYVYFLFYLCIGYVLEFHDVSLRICCGNLCFFFRFSSIFSSFPCIFVLTPTKENPP